MTPVDIWAASAATLCCTAIAIRARMLRPKQRAWTHAPVAVWGSLSLLALAIGMRAVTIWFGAHAAAGEAVVDSALAFSSMALLWNLNRTGRLAEAKCQEAAEEVRQLMAASGPAATYPFERRHG